jgi:hypothetical protein
MMKTTCLLALMVLVSAASVSAADDKDKDDSKTAATSDKDKAQSDLDKVICKTSHATGSRVEVKRTCMTRREWAEASERSSRDLHNLERSQNGAQPQVNPLTGQ